MSLETMTTTQKATYEGACAIEPVSLGDLMENHVAIAECILEGVKPKLSGVG